MTVGQLIEMQHFFNDLSEQTDEELIKELIEDEDAMLELARKRRNCYQEIASMSVNDFEQCIQWAKAYEWVKKYVQRHEKKFKLKEVSP